jgi:CubicO group peptidase (beta-lactamase class C family)
VILERATRSRVSDYMAARLWRPLGAEADASWSLDSTRSGFEKMESGVNARAMDFARFGQLFLHEGAVGARRVVPREWARAATERGDPAAFYGYMWWIDPAARAGRAPFFARGLDPPGLRHEVAGTELLTGEEVADAHPRALPLPALGERGTPDLQPPAARARGGPLERLELLERASGAHGHARER